MPVTGNTDYESTTIAKRQIDARERAHACTHTHTRTLSFPLPVSHRVPSPNVFLLNSSARRKRPAAATAGISCSRTTAPMRLTAAGEAIRERERKKERERESRGVSVLHRPYDDGTSIASSGYGLIARAAVKKAADRRNRALQSGARTRSRHSVDYRRAVCSSMCSLRILLVAAPFRKCAKVCLHQAFPVPLNPLSTPNCCG